MITGGIDRPITCDTNGMPASLAAFAAPTSLISYTTRSGLTLGNNTVRSAIVARGSTSPNMVIISVTTSASPCRLRASVSASPIEMPDACASKPRSRTALRKLGPVANTTSWPAREECSHRPEFTLFRSALKLSKAPTCRPG
ncbi:hypothetical protein C8D88_104467 [Lentzea atacamensis]|uniref:Uncharacterized protein n=1 Tax=Lentzea atacamensis TaxID=531938 RepID=A0A316I1N3_9PSEU|nr:hypothetical protein C8D88_104467 [Lentzea atacamensis]